MKTLMLLRHAKSSWDKLGGGEFDDFARPLAKRGRKSAKAMAKWLRGQPWRPELVLCSSSERTRQTYDRMGPVLAGVPVTFDRGLYEADSGALLARMRGLPPTLATVLVIGHNPAIERLAAHLARGPSPQLDRLRLKFPTGALAVLVLDEGEWPALTLGACRLEAFVRPADMDEE